MTYDPVIVINPKGTRQRVTLGDAIRLYEGKYYNTSNRGLQAIAEIKRRKKRCAQQHEYYENLKKDPVRWAKYQERIKNGRTHRRL